MPPAGIGPTAFLGSKASRSASPMKTRRLSITASAKKAVKPSHGACRFDLPCWTSSPSDGLPGEQAEAQEVEAGQRGDRAGQDERQEGDRRHHGVRQHVLEHDHPVGLAQRLWRRGHSRSCARAGTPARTTPTSAIQLNSSIRNRKRPEPRNDEARHDDQQVEHRQALPDLDHPLGRSGRSSRPK